MPETRERTLEPDAEGQHETDAADDLLISVASIREARERDHARSDGGTSGKSDTNDMAP